MHLLFIFVRVLYGKVTGQRVVATFAGKPMLKKQRVRAAEISDVAARLVTAMNVDPATDTSRATVESLADRLESLYSGWKMPADLRELGLTARNLYGNGGDAPASPAAWPSPVP
jgi:alcohol dehydrogenase class IV